MKKLCILKFGCTFSNYYQIINSCQNKYKIVRDLGEADWCIFPFCSCTEEHIKLTENQLRDFFTYRKPTCKLIVTGCISYVKENKKEFLKKYPIDFLVSMENQVEEICKILGVTPSNSIYTPYSISGSVIISDGCTNKCSFCRIHYSNRPLHSFSMEVIENQVKDLVANGIKFINLKGLNASLYGIDLYGVPMLHVLLQRISKIKGIEELSITGISISDIYDDLVSEICENDLIDSLWIDIQSGSNRLLKLMNVGHTVDDIKQLFSLIGDKIIDSFVITGFPTETEEDVINTLSLLKDLGISKKIRLSKYINSQDTPSSKLEQLSEEEATLHFKMYEAGLSKLSEVANTKNEERIYIGYISAIALYSLHAYCPEIHRCVSIEFSDKYPDLNINDKVKLRFSEGRFSILEVLEKSLVETVVPEISDNPLINYLTADELITSNLTYPYSYLDKIFLNYFKLYEGYDSNLEDFKKNISDTPDFLQKALLEYYYYIHDSDDSSTPTT